ncbi:MAG: potassium channel protein [Aphanocapsa sp. GSE-SYN-MK-11-07L]|jgi:voltage-gated potassium channel|nr:potassium channel protein [Aphanocapsa sp. GSE-SYN-MK-11-07L]
MDLQDRNLQDSSLQDRNLQDHVIICGFGYVGKSLAQQLTDSQVKFVVVDSQPEQLAVADAMGYLTCHGNAIDESVLQAAGVKRAKVLATVLPNDAGNVFITLTARELNPKLTILARGDLPETEHKLRLAGADHVILLATTTALRMINLITRPTTLDYLGQRSNSPTERQSQRTHLIELLMQLDLQIDELPILPDSPLKGLTLADLEAEANGAFITIALRDSGGRIDSEPALNLRLQAGDTAIVLGHQNSISFFAKRYTRKSEIRYRGKPV